LFAYIKGTFSKALDDSIIVDINGVGFELFVSIETIQHLPPLGNEVKLHTIMQVKDDSITLLGFNSNDEKRMYQYLTSVSGVGSKSAMLMLSGLGTASLASTIIAGDIRTLSSVKGIGKKTAERIVLELTEKLAKDASFWSIGDYKTGSTEFSHGTMNDALLALQSLGIPKGEAQSVLQSIPNRNDLNLEDLIVESLRKINQK
jgi:Holliday junction DNA helicase RuvA